MKRIILMLLLALGLWGKSVAASGGVEWEKFPQQKANDLSSLQNGAKLFVNYCLNCHSASYMRYNRLSDLGLTEDQIKKNLMFATDKVGDLMQVSMDPKQAKQWFGVNPPDLTLVARSRSAVGKGTGSDYLYTYLRTYYRDDSRPTGWNNLAFPNVGMPHVLWQLQGQRIAHFKTNKDPTDSTKTVQSFDRFEMIAPGSMSEKEYDSAITDLVGFLHWMSEPMRQQRQTLGLFVLGFLALFTLIAWRLNSIYWKDIK
jgi:ubiquinol-cytochrome c reductase cytochrome c1 subunit